MKKLLSLALSASLLAAAAAPAGAVYQDIPSGSALAGEVQKAVDYGLMNGYSAENFGYADPMTRAQFVTVLDRMLLPQGNDETLIGHITPAMQVDYQTVKAYYDSIDAAAEHDWVDTDQPFRPSDPITRGEMAEILVRALGLKGAAKLAESASTLPFTDVAEGRGYIAVAYAIGMTKGTSDTTFSPDATATRAQAAAMLVRIYEKLGREPDWMHGFYAISSYSQLSYAQDMDAVSAGWSHMVWDGTSASLETTTANGNTYYIPDGYESVTNSLDASGTPLNLNVFMEGSSLREMLSSETGRQEAAEAIIQEVTAAYAAIGKNPYAGVTIDFEGLRAADRDNFTDFLRQLSDLLDQVQERELSLYVCVQPALATGSYYDGYDYRAIGDLADQVILMAYDYDARDLSGYEGTTYHQTACPAPIDQVFYSLMAITDADSGVQDRSKVVLGFSCKNVAWQIDESGKLVSGTPVYPSNETVSKRLQQSDTVLGWSDAYQHSYAIYTTEDGSRYFLWYQNADTLQKAMEAAALLDVSAVSVWRLGAMPMYPAWNWSCLL